MLSCVGYLFLSLLYMDQCVVYCTVLHCTVLHCTAQHCTQSSSYDNLLFQFRSNRTVFLHQRDVCQDIPISSIQWRHKSKEWYILMIIIYLLFEIAIDFVFFFTLFALCFSWLLSHIMQYSVTWQYIYTWNHIIYNLYLLLLIIVKLFLCSYYNLFPYLIFTDTYGQYCMTLETKNRKIKSVFSIFKVLETRKGRCGEYSVLMMRFLEELGYDSKWVVDWADHVRTYRTVLYCILL